MPADLVGAIGLVPDLSRERLLGWATVFGAELARRAAAWLDVWLKHPRSEKRPQSASSAECALRDWKAKLDLGHLTVEDIDRQIEAKRQRWLPKVAGASKDDSAERAAVAAAEAREKRLRERWGQLGDGEREAIRAAVRAANPGLHRWPAMLEPLYLAELERRLSADPTRGP